MDLSGAKILLPQRMTQPGSSLRKNALSGAPMLVVAPPRAFLECVPVGLAPGIQLRFGAQVSPESLVVTAKEPSRFNGSDQLSQGAT